MASNAFIKKGDPIYIVRNLKDDSVLAVGESELVFYTSTDTYSVERVTGVEDVELLFEVKTKSDVEAQKRADAGLVDA